MRRTIGVLGVVAWLGVMPGPLARAEGTPDPVQDKAREQAESVFAQGEKLLASGDTEGALRSWRESLPLYQKAGDGTGEGRASFRVGVVTLVQRGDCQQALPSLKQAVPLLRAAHHTWEGEATYYQALCQEQVGGDAREVFELYQRAIPLLESPDKRLLQAFALTSVGNTLHEQGHSMEALEPLKRAVPLLHAEKQVVTEAAVCQFIANINEDMGEYEPAREYYLKTLPLLQASGNRIMEADMNHRLASIADRLGRFQEALTYEQRGLSLHEEAHNPAGVAQAQSALGMFYIRMRLYPLARQYFQRAYDSWGEVGRQAEQAGPPPRGPEDLGRVMDEAYRQQARGRHQVEQLSNLKMLGQAYDQEGKWQEALESYEQALSLARASKDGAAEADLQTWIGQVWAGQKELARARDAYEQALRVSQELGDARRQVLVLGQLSELHAGQGELLEATRLTERIDSLLGEVTKPDLRATLLGALARLHRRLDDPARALRYDEQALALLEQLGKRNEVASALDTIGIDHDLMGEEQKALEFYERAIALGESVRAEAGAEEMKTYLASNLADTYALATRLLLKRGEVTKAFELGERGRARSFLDALGNARPRLGGEAEDELVRQHRELSLERVDLNRRISDLSSRTLDAEGEAIRKSMEQWRTTLQLEAEDVLIRLEATHPRYASLQSVEPLALAEVQKLLDERTTLVSYLQLEHVVAFVVTRRSIDAVELPITPAQLEELVPKAFGPEAFASLQEVPTDVLQQLHEALVKPLVPLLKTPRVGLIPQGVLHYVPFAALTDGKQYFGDARTLFTLPSASTLRFLPSQRSGKGPVLAMAQAQAPGFPVLSSANPEALSIARLYGARPLSGPAATEAAFKKAAPKASVLHLAAHGELNASSPLFSRLLLAPGDGEDGSLSVEEIYGLDLSASRLVVLSACQSNLGAHSKGEEVVGLTRAFLYARAPSVVSSLWKVKDEASRVLMTEFHTQLKKGKPKAEALREAQARTRARFPHPYYWAAFVLTGDPG